MQVSGVNSQQQVWRVCCSGRSGWFSPRGLLYRKSKCSRIFIALPGECLLHPPVREKVERGGFYKGTEQDGSAPSCYLFSRAPMRRSLSCTQRICAVPKSAGCSP